MILILTPFSNEKVHGTFVFNVDSVHLTDQNYAIACLNLTYLWCLSRTALLVTHCQHISC